MKLTKFTHSCFTLEKDGQTLIFDPGNWSSDLTIPDNVVAIVLTHEHADHFDMHLLRQITDKNRSAVIIAPKEMTSQLAGLRVTSVAPGDDVTVGPFDLKFFGGQHAMIHPSLGSVANVGVLVDDTFYYPGDSFALPNTPVETLALPVTAPWLKISEPIDFMLEVKPDFVFPVHDQIASTEGKALVDQVIGGFAERNNIRYQRVIGSIDLTQP